MYEYNEKYGRYHSNVSPNVNDIVIIKDDTSRGHWRCGKFIKLTFSKDGREVGNGKDSIWKGHSPTCQLTISTGSDIQSTDTCDQNGKVVKFDTTKTTRNKGSD